MTTYFNYPSEALQAELKKIAQALVAPGKGKKDLVPPGKGKLALIAPLVKVNEPLLPLEI